MTVKLYDPGEVSILVDGIPISGYADGEFVTIDQDEDSFTSVVGTDGHASRSKNENKMGKVVIKLMQTSKLNDVLSALHNADRLAPGGAGIVDVLVKDNNGTQLYHSTESWITKPPAKSFDKSAKSREWTFATTDPQEFDGGT